MTIRNCPVCKDRSAKIIMEFTPELISQINPTYKPEIFQKAVEGKEHMLTYSQCSNCKMVYCENIWPEQVLREVYENTIDHIMSKQKTLKINKRLSLVRGWENILYFLLISGKETLEDLKLIDFGCGWGDFLDVVHGYGINAAGYDTDSIKISLPKERGPEIFSNTEELKSFGPVDVLVMNSVLEHVQDVESTLNLVKELLNPDGLFVFTVMDYRAGYIRKNVDRLRNGLPALTKNLNPVEHVNIYDYGAVMTTMTNYNFRVIATHPVLRASSLIRFINRMRIINILNRIERLSSAVLANKERSITVYAANSK